ncbi:MAG: hypothetical protein V2I37_05460 [Marinilabiliaceae bacterium]|nr:hypothetical protein [Marinilabiliaceae bacterium]
MPVIHSRGLKWFFAFSHQSARVLNHSVRYSLHHLFVMIEIIPFTEKDHLIASAR